MNVPVRSPMASPDLARLAAEARYARERYDLYRAKVYGPRPTSQSRLRKLERACLSAEARLLAASANESAEVKA